MARASSRNIGSLIQRRNCPCGDNQCYLQINTNEEEEHNQSTGNTNSDTNSADFEQQVQAAELHNSSDFIPNGTTQLFPYVGQIFQTSEEAQEYYARFARDNGFAIRTERSKGNANHPLGVYKRELVCHRGGAYRPRKTADPKRQRNKKSNRCNCEAGMIIKKNVCKGMTRWIIVQFRHEHNHEMLDNDEVLQLPAYRNISSVDRERALALARTGCTVNQIMRALETEKGLKHGDQLTFTERDLRNFLQASKNINIENEGAELLSACRAMKERHSEFEFEFSVVPENGTLENICWVYPDCARAYAVFGDAVVFDTTYRLYAYDRPVGVWFGMDNYGNVICFGCALLQDEKPSSYQWALQSFVRLMDGKSPQTLLTDLNPSLKDAITTELPTTRHAFAPWYIKSKLYSWFAPSLGAQYEHFEREFDRVCDVIINPGEFGDRWDEMVGEFGLGLDRHVSFLACNREYWSVPFLRGWFFGCFIGDAEFPGLIKGFFRGLLSTRTRLRDFVEQVRIAIELQNQAGEESMMQRNYQNIRTKTCMPMEEHAALVLSPYAFVLLQRELVTSTQFAVYETHRDQAYLVRHRLQETGGEVVMCVDEFLRCSCKEFESSGILCRHALRVLSLKNCFALPDKYLLTRWRRESSIFPKSTDYNYRSRALRSLMSIITQEASVNKERFNYAQLQMSEILLHVREMPPALDEPGPDGGPGPSLEGGNVVKIRPRGRPKKAKLVDTPQEELWETHVDLFGAQDLE